MFYLARFRPRPLGLDLGLALARHVGRLVCLQLCFSVVKYAVIYMLGVRGGVSGLLCV